MVGTRAPVDEAAGPGRHLGRGVGVDDDETVDALGEGTGGEDGDAAAHGVADQDTALDGEGVERGDYVGEVGVDGVGGLGRPVAVAVSAGVEGDDAPLQGEAARDALPVAGAGGEPVEEEDGGRSVRRGGGPLDVREVQAIAGYAAGGAA